jgi:Xaa-Pro aminopeptidase
MHFMKYSPLPQDAFIFNRRRFSREIQPGSLAIFNANDQMPRSGDTCYPFRQNTGLYWLTGIDQEETMLFLFPGCQKEKHEEVLFIKRTNEHIAVWEGHKYTKEEAREASGIQKVYFLDEGEVIMREMINLSSGTYLNFNEHDKFTNPVETRDLRYARWFRNTYPGHQVYRSQPLLKKLQVIKTQWEVETVQHAIDITGLAFNRVLKFVAPEVGEYEVEAEITHEFIRNRASGHAYEPIIASGKNACVLHYIDNNKICADGDLLLMDFGCEYANYAADLTRTIPVNGRFSDRQRAVYNAVLRVLKEARTMLVPGTLLEEYNKEVGKIMESELLGLGLISRKDIEDQNPDWPAYKKYFMHGTSHHLGLDVHDLSHRYEPFRAGMIFTCEPGIYIPEEAIGVRIENDILITDDGPFDLFRNIPVEVEEIETLMQERASVVV